MNNLQREKFLFACSKVKSLQSNEVFPSCDLSLGLFAGELPSGLSRKPDPLEISNLFVRRS